MFDGIDMQVSGYFLILIIFLLIKFNIAFLIYFIPVILFNCALNFKKKLFLGIGTNIISILIAWVIIKNYNLNNSFTCEEIFIIMAIPGLDRYNIKYTNYNRFTRNTRRYTYQGNFRIFLLNSSRIYYLSFLLKYDYNTIYNDNFYLYY